MTYVLEAFFGVGLVKGRGIGFGSPLFFTAEGAKLKAILFVRVLEPQGGFEPANLPITNRLRCHCATGA